jgi:hypothetical protein
MTAECEQRGPVRRRRRQGVGGAQRGDGLQGRVGGLLRAVGVAGEIAVAGQPDQGGPERERLVGHRQQPDGPLGLGDGLVVAVGVVELPGVVVVQAGAFGVGQAVGVPQGGLEQRQGLAVGARGRGLAAGGGCVGHHRVDIPGLDGVMDQPGQVAGDRRG